MAPAAFSSSSSGGSSPATSPGLFTPGPAQADEINGGYNFGISDAESSETTAHLRCQQTPIAIVGMSCRLPGGASSPAEFWELCSRARSGFVPGVPKHRFNHEAFYHTNPGKTGTYHSQGGYFLGEDVTAFDAPFFSLTEKEAIAMDPQQRLLLECTFEALESAGIPKHTVVGEEVGVFIGGSLSEYETHLSRDSDSMPMYQSTGCAHAMQSNRLSHFFDFRGPSFTVDTACSSSLVALHVACQSLRNGESSVAITGACHLNMLPDSFISFSTGRLLSDSGRSIAFDERGSGFGRGEGCGILVLKPLDRALADMDAIRAVIVGTGINQDGKTAGITMPNGDAQEKLIKQVYYNAGLDPKDCGFVEAHGTGTKIGDPTEVGAIYRALGQDRCVRDPLFMGSVKSNIGHLEAASGVAAVIKAALMLERGFILPNHDFKTPNTKIPWKEWNVTIPKSQRPWPKGKKYVSVNNFGFGGTNAHVVLERAPFPAKKSSLSRRLPSVHNHENKDQAGHRRLFVLSGNNKRSLEAVMANLVVYLEQRPEIFQSDLLDHLSYTLSRRSLLKWRVAIPAVTSFELIEALNSNSTVPAKAAITGKVQTSELQIGFVFTGQGAQWHAMGRELYGQHGYPVYTAALDLADRCLQKLGAQWSLVDELTRRDAQTSRVSEAHISQPACTAVQLCLVELLRSWGIRPVAVTGHSSGEIAAAYAAGMITFESAMAIAYHRGRMIPILKDRFPDLEGAMMAVGGSKEDVQPLIDAVNSTLKVEKKDQQIRIACYNSPSSLTISGDSAGITLLENLLHETQPDTFNRRLQVDVAYHSHHMDLISKEYRESLCSLPLPRAVSRVQFHSSLYGRQIQGNEGDSDYWVDNLTRPVRFSEALGNLVKLSANGTPVNMLIELGPHSALQGPIKQIFQACGVAKSVPYCSALTRKRSAVETALELAASLISKGGLVNMNAINMPTGNTKERAMLLTDLPRYSWNHQNKYWHESRLSRMHSHRGSTGARCELIGVEAIYSTNIEPAWRNVFTLDDLPWLRHHQIQGLVVFPLAAFVAMAVEAATQQARKRDPRSADSLLLNAVELKDIEVLKPLAFPADVVDGNAGIELSIILRRRHDQFLNEEWDEFRICSWSTSAEWTEHCIGLVMMKRLETIETADQQKIIDEVTTATERHDAVNITAAEMTDMYESLSKGLGIGYGPSFQGIRDCKASNQFAVGNISNTSTTDVTTARGPVLHPTVLEAIFDMYWPILRQVAAKEAQDIVYLPSSIRRMCIKTEAGGAQTISGLKAYCAADFTELEPRPTAVNIFATTVMGGSGESGLTVSIDGLVVSPIIERGDLENEDDGLPRQLCYKYEWDALERDCTFNESVPPSAIRDAEIAIIYGETGSVSYLLASQLAVVLEAATSRLPSLEGGTFSLAASGAGTSLDHIKSTLSGKTCIVFTELDQSFLPEATETQFEALKALASSARHTMWLTSGAYLGATVPAANIISGLARTIRSETTMPFAHLDFEGTYDFRHDSEEVSRVILDVLCSAFCDSGIKSMEYSYRAGRLLVPRIVNDSHMDQLAQRSTNPDAMEMQLFSQATSDDRVLRMQFAGNRASSSSKIHAARHTNAHFIEDREFQNAPLAEDEVEFEVKAVGVSRHDAQVAHTGSSSVSAGLEASGIVTRVGVGVGDRGIHIGARIACLTAAIKKSGPGAYASFARASAATVLVLPSTSDPGSPPAISFEEAAALPIAYCTAYYSLIDQARLEAGQRLLITCPCQPVGQAAICLARMIGATVYVVVRSPEEKLLITSQKMGAIPEDHVLSSFHPANGETYHRVMRVTDGAGVDVVLNLTSSDQKESCVPEIWTACLASFGRLVHIQEPLLPGSQHDSRVSRRRFYDIRPSSFLDDVPRPANTTVLTVDLLALGTERPQVLDRIFAKVASLLQESKIQVITPVHTFPLSRADEAFKTARGQDPDTKPGKSVLVFNADDSVMAPPAPTSREILRKDATYIIVGGTGGLGRSMANWMVQHGAAHVVLVSRRGKVTPVVQTLINEAKTVGAHIYVHPCNIADELSVASLLQWITAEATMPPVRGVVHSAMVLHDVLFEKMTHADYKAVIESKVHGAWNLHCALDGRETESNKALDFFVVISSVSAIVGNRGQAAYAAANTFLDALVQHRLAKGLPAVSLALAAVSDAGYLADAESGGAARAAEVLRNLGGDIEHTICEAEVLALLRAAVMGRTASCQHHVITGVGNSKKSSSASSLKKSLPFWAEDAKFTELVRDARAGCGDEEEGTEGDKSDLAALLHPSLTQAEAEDIVCRGLVAKIAEILMIEPDELDVTRSLSYYPLDSLVAIEIRNFIARQYEANMQVLELLSSGSIQTLSGGICRKSKLCQF